MKLIPLCLLAIFGLVACQNPITSVGSKDTRNAINGTWKLISATVIDNKDSTTGDLTSNTANKGDTTITDYTGDISFIKIINHSHFAFLQHDLSKGKDSNAAFSAGGGKYTLKDSTYTEHLEYCSDRQWEGNDFSFTVKISNDTLTQVGIEQIESAGINRLNMEKYVRVKP